MLMWWRWDEPMNRGDVQLMHKRKVMSLSMTRPRADRFQQPQATDSQCLHPAPSATDRSCLGSRPEDRGLHSPWPGRRRDTSANRNSERVNSDDSGDDSSSCKVPRARYGAGTLLTSWRSHFPKSPSNLERWKRKCKCFLTQFCPTLCDSVDCSPPGSSVHGFFRQEYLECVAISFSRGSSWLGVNLGLPDCKQTDWATRKVHNSKK